MNADEIRLTVIKAIFSTPQLEEILTLKGGNAMKLQGLTDRQSSGFSIFRFKRIFVYLSNKMDLYFFKASKMNSSHWGIK